MTSHRGRLKAIVRVAAILTVALYLVPEGAHVLELATKLRLSPADYMIVQRIYDGWALFGVVILAALALTLAHALSCPRRSIGRCLSGGAFAALVLTQVAFWTLVYPQNVASANWTVMPVPFDPSRWRWEIGHAIGAALTMLALILAILSALAAARAEAQG